MNNLIIDKLPSTVKVNGSLFAIRTDFRVSILFEMMMMDDNVSDMEKIDVALSLYYPHIPPNISEAVEQMMWFYRCGKEQEEQKSGSKESAERVFSFDHDAEYIYSAFLQQYSIDLVEVDQLHWWKFKALFLSLDEHTRLMKIIGYRSADTTKMSKEQKQYYRKMKELYRLPDLRTEEQKHSDFASIFAKGMKKGR